jgi:CheY-like chemotaxis protein
MVIVDRDDKAIGRFIRRGGWSFRPDDSQFSRKGAKARARSGSRRNEAGPIGIYKGCETFAPCAVLLTPGIAAMIVVSHSTGSAIVLVVEDEMLLRMRAVDMVEDAGFASIEAVDADEAVAILESRSDIALLLTDIQMPGSLDGLKLAHAVRARWPRIKIILVSGQLQLTDTDIPADSRFFGKPLEAETMIAVMQNMIGHA